MEPSTTTRFYFDTLQAAAAGLLTVLLDARTTKSTYQFSNLSAPQVLSSGILLEGQISEVVLKLEKVAGSSRYEE